MMVYTRDRLVRGYGEWLASLQPNCFVTFTTNWDSSHARVSSDPQRRRALLQQELDRWTVRVEHARLGRNWCKHPARMRGFGQVEHLDTNAHVHAALHVPASSRAISFDTVADSVWQRLVPSGGVYIDYDTSRAGGFCRYVCKESRSATRLLDQMLLIGPTH